MHFPRFPPALSIRANIPANIEEEINIMG